MAIYYLNRKWIPMIIKGKSFFLAPIFSFWLLSLGEASCCIEFFISDIAFFTSRSFIWLLYLLFHSLLCFYFPLNTQNIVIIAVLSFLSANSIISVISGFVSVNDFSPAYFFSCFLAYMVISYWMLGCYIVECLNFIVCP